MKRHLDDKISNHFKKYKQVLILLGSRQVGKTTIINKIFKNSNYLLVDNQPIYKTLESYDIESYKLLIDKQYQIIIIDEIHLLSNPGRAAKIIYDQLVDVKLVITGSSSFHIKNKTSESLAGRKIDYHIYPLTFSEFLYQKGIETDLNYNIFRKATEAENNFSKIYHHFDLESVLENILIYGQYPMAINYPADKKFILNFVDSLIFKDILELNLIENKRLAKDLLKLLALQIGNLINYSELALNLKADQRTIKRYIEIFEQSFILFRLYPYSKNKRDEISKSPKIYFYDTGLRNAIIDNFTSISTRSDKGALFENFIIADLIKQNSYLDANFYFYYWRTKQGSEIDLVLENGDQLIALEIKYHAKKVNKAFKRRYPQTILKSLNAQTFY